MPRKSRRSKWHTFSADEKAVLKVFLDDRLAQIRETKGGVLAAWRAGTNPGAKESLAYLDHAESWVRYCYHLLRLPRPPEVTDADPDQPGSGSDTG